MYSKIMTAILRGIEPRLISVETDIADGLPCLELVGYVTSEVKEARERVFAALKNCGVKTPPKRITINLSPAGIRKSGTAFDLPIAAGVLTALNQVESKRVERLVMVGELGLNGDILPVDGILSILSHTPDMREYQYIIPKGNLEEAMLLGSRLPPLVAIGHLSELQEAIRCLCNKEYIMPKENEKYELPGRATGTNDFAHIFGQTLAKRACEVAVSGMHNMLLVGPPGTGKSAIAAAIPTILPLMSKDEQLEVSKIYSVAGKFERAGTLMHERPFRSPHYTVTAKGLTGGGANPQPGEISLAHNGVLFLDELAEFKRETIEILRQPMEEGKVSITRQSGTWVFPSEFMLVAATNPCPCGFYPDFSKCQCSAAEIRRYIGKISGPVMDRIDISVRTESFPFASIWNKKETESSAEIRRRVEQVHGIQRERFQKEQCRYNAGMNHELIERYCELTPKLNRQMEVLFDSSKMSMRGYLKLLKVARTIADMEGKERIEEHHLDEAVIYRSMDTRSGLDEG